MAKEEATGRQARVRSEGPVPIRRDLSFSVSNLEGLSIKGELGTNLCSKYHSGY